MKKYLLLLSLVTLVLTTSCFHDDEDENKQTFTATVNNRAWTGDDDFRFSQGSSKVEINFTKRTIQFNYDFKDVSGQSQTYNTSEMELTLEKGSVYRFGSNTSSLSGHIDLATGMMHYVNYIGDAWVHTTTHLLYAYTSTTIADEEGRTSSHEQSGYLFTLDSKGETCDLQITNFVPTVNGAIQAAALQYKGLKVTATREGYTIATSDPVASQQGIYPITSAKFSMSNDGLVVDGSFKVGDYEFTVKGDMFTLAN